MLRLSCRYHPGPWHFAHSSQISNCQHLLVYQRSSSGGLHLLCSDMQQAWSAGELVPSQLQPSTKHCGIRAYIQFPNSLCRITEAYILSWPPKFPNRVEFRLSVVAISLNMSFLQASVLPVLRPYSDKVLALEFVSQSTSSESELALLCPTLSNPVDCSPPGSSVHGILQARILEWVAISGNPN